MRGTSSTSFAEVLRQAEAAFAASSGALEAEAQELFSVADAIDSGNQLVRTPSDPARPAGAKVAAVRPLLRRADSPQSLGRTLAAVGRRWSAREYILDARGLLGVSGVPEQAQAEGVAQQVAGELV